MKECELVCLNFDLYKIITCAEFKVTEKKYKHF